MSTPKPLISFDYAIKYLLKDKQDYCILESFLSSILNKTVKIIALLDTESLQEDPKHKRSLADLMIEDTEQNRYIVEIERHLQRLFVHKSIFNTSRLIVDHLGQGQDYARILKVFHISLLYFPLDEHAKGVFYHGKTVIHDVDHQSLSLSLTDSETGKTFQVSDIFPEYFYIAVPSFNDQIRRTLDVWLHVLKHDEVPAHCTLPIMQKVQERLNVLHMKPQEQEAYWAYLKQIHTDRDQLRSARDQGRSEGLQEGLERGIKQGLTQGLAEGKNTKALEIAKNLLKSGMSILQVAQVTGLSEEEVASIQ